MLLLDKGIAFIAKKACFLTIKRMLSSAENCENRLVLSIYFTFTCHLSPITYYLIAATVSRLLRKVDRIFLRNLTVAGAISHLLRPIFSPIITSIFSSITAFAPPAPGGPCLGRYAHCFYQPGGGRCARAPGYRTKVPSASLCLLGNALGPSGRFQPPQPEKLKQKFVFSHSFL